MECKQKPAVFPTRPRGNCLISNFGKVPEGRERSFRNLCTRWVTCLQHVVAPLFLFFSPVLQQCCRAHVRTNQRKRLAGSRAQLTKPRPRCTQECVCMPGHVLQQRPRPQLHREGKFEKQEPSWPHPHRRGQNGRRAAAVTPTTGLPLN